MTELERALVALGNDLDLPPVPELWSGVHDRLHRRRWRAAALALAVVVVALGIAFAVPPARSAILRFLHLGAATVERVETLPPARHRALTAGLGPAVTRAAAERRSGVELRLPRVTPPARYYARPGLLSTVLRVDGKPVLLSELRGNQMGLAKKLVDARTAVEPVELGEFGLWLHGGEHVLMWQVDVGQVRTIQTRFAGDVLLWLSGGTTYRLEGDVGQARLLRLAREITP